MFEKTKSEFAHVYLIGTQISSSESAAAFLIHAGCVVVVAASGGGAITTLIEQCSMHTLEFVYTKCLCTHLRHVSHKDTLPGRGMLFNIHSQVKYPNKNKRIPVRFFVDFRAAKERRTCRQGENTDEGKQNRTQNNAQSFLGCLNVYMPIKYKHQQIDE